MKRHKIGKVHLKFSEVVDVYYQKMPAYLVRLENGQDLNFYAVTNNINIVIINAILSEQPKELIHTSFRYYLDFGLAHYKRALALHEEVKVKLGHSEFTCSKTIASDYAIGSRLWFNLFYVALILKDQASQKTLLNLIPKIKEEDVFLVNCLKYLELIFTTKDKVLARKKVLDVLVEESKTDIGLFIGLQGNKKIKIKGRSEWVQAMSLPRIQLHELRLSNAVGEFDVLLKEYLKGRKKIIVKKRKHNSREYWIDFGALACCSLAHDQGFKLSTKSEYIPSWIYKEKWNKLDILF